MKYGSVCSGVEAATTAWHPLGWEPQWFSEIEKFPSAVHRDGMVVRRLTPIECERLQGFPDGYTQIAWRNKAPEDCPDGPRYKAMGNSMAVPVMQWIGKRIQMMETANDTARV